MWLSCKLISLVIFAKPKKSMRLSKDHTHSIYGSVIPLKHVKPVLRYPFTLICVSIFFFSFYNNVVILLLSTIHTCAFSLVEAVWTELSVRLSISSSHCLFDFVSSPSACLRLRYVCLSFPCSHLDCTGFVPLNLLLQDASRTSFTQIMPLQGDVCEAVIGLGPTDCSGKSLCWTYSLLIIISNWTVEDMQPCVELLCG